MIESCGKLIGINYSDPISGRNAAQRGLYVVRRRRSVASFVLTFSRVPYRVERRSSAGSVRYFTYLHLVYSPESFAVASQRKSTRKLFRQVTELMVTIDHEFVGKNTSPPFASLSYPFHMGMSFLLGILLTRVFCCS